MCVRFVELSLAQVFSLADLPPLLSIGVVGLSATCLLVVHGSSHLFSPAPLNLLSLSQYVADINCTLWSVLARAQRCQLARSALACLFSSICLNTYQHSHGSESVKFCFVIALTSINAWRLFVRSSRPILSNDHRRQ